MSKLAAILALVVSLHAHAEVNPSLVGTTFTANCSGSVVAFEDYRPDQKALYMTNGHCLRVGNYLGRFLNPRGFIRDVQKEEWVDLILNSPGRFGFGQSSVKIQTSKIILATMHLRDIAIFELKDSYEEIESEYSITPFIFRRVDGLQPGTPVEIVSGLWKSVYSCTFSHLASGYVTAGPFFWSHALVLNDCNRWTKGGTSGSPVLLSGTSYVIGLHSAADQGSPKRCSLYDACERDQNGNRVSKPGDGFAQNLNFLFLCRGQDGALDLDAPACVFRRKNDECDGGCKPP